MAVLFAVWVPVVAVAHAVGLALFVYGFECSSGLLTKTSQGLRRHLPSLALRPQRLQKECVASETEGFAQKLGARVNETCSGASTPVLAQVGADREECQVITAIQSGDAPGAPEMHRLSRRLPDRFLTSARNSVRSPKSASLLEVVTLKPCH